MLAIDSLSKDDAPSYVSAFTINRMWYKSAEPQCSLTPGLAQTMATNSKFKMMDGPAADFLSRET